MNTLRSELDRFHRLNSAVQPGCAVLFGANRFANIPIGELARDLGADVPIYNRSIEGMTLKEADAALGECIYSLSPARIFINLGEEDLRKPDFDLHSFLSAYEWLLYTLNSHAKGKAQLYIVSILSSHPAAAAANDGLSRLAEETGCTYIDVTRAAAYENIEIRIFEILRCFLRGRAICFSEAFNLSCPMQN